MKLLELPPILDYLERDLLQELFKNPVALITRTRDDNGKMVMFHISIGEDFWLPDQKERDYLQSIPKEDRENLIKLAKAKRLRYEADELEKSITL